MSIEAKKLYLKIIGDLNLLSKLHDLDNSDERVDVVVKECMDSGLDVPLEVIKYVLKNLPGE
ncbi:MAG: hypothetical protein JEY79_15820 [Pseudodesulfovibrio sp.]|nr:hypothetical protein [Pseudodesulfovibrio sp.]